MDSAFPQGVKVADLPPRIKSLESRWGCFIAPDSKNGGVYLAINDSMTGWGQSKDSFVVALNKDGGLRWITQGKTLGTPQVQMAPGEIGCLRRIAGIAHDCVVVNDFWEGPWPLSSYVWDRDGLWVGGLMDEIDRNAAPNWRYGAGAEALGTTMITDPKTGQVYLYWHGYNDIRVGRVIGWDGWVRESGKVTLDKAAPASTPRLTEVPPGTGKGLLLEFWDQTQPEKTEPVVVRLTDVNNENWGLMPEAGGPDGFRLLGGGRSARVTGELEAFQTGWHSFVSDGYFGSWKIGDTQLKANSFNEIYMEAGKRYPDLG